MKRRRAKSITHIEQLSPYNSHHRINDDGFLRHRDFTPGPIGHNDVFTPSSSYRKNPLFIGNKGSKPPTEIEFISSKAKDEKQRIFAKIKVVGHASPRFKSSESKEDSDKRNLILSHSRAVTVVNKIKKHINELFPDKKIIFNVQKKFETYSNFSISSSSQGSKQTLQESGNRGYKANDREMRRVDVNVSLEFDIETIVTEKYLESKMVSGASTSWSIRLTGSGGVSVGASAKAGLLSLRNNKTKITAEYASHLTGIDVGLGIDAGNISFSYSNFTTPKPMSFADFDGARFHIPGGPKVQLGPIGLGASWLLFTEFVGGQPTPGRINLSGFSCGGLGGSFASYLVGVMYKTGSPKEHLIEKKNISKKKSYKASALESTKHRTYFKTNSFNISNEQDDLLGAYLATIVQSFRENY